MILYRKFQRGSAVPTEASVKEVSFVNRLKGTFLNPKNWGVEDLTDSNTTFGKAYENARLRNMEEFIFQGKRYNTENSGTDMQQVGMYGNTNNLDSQSVSAIGDAAGSRANGEHHGWDFNYNTNTTEQIKEEHKVYSAAIAKSKKINMRKLLSLSNLVGNPSVRYSGDKQGSRMYGRSSFRPITNEIFLSDQSGLIPEYSHAYRHKNEENESISLIKDWFKKPWVTSAGQNETYDIPGQGEHDSHNKVEPALDDFMYGNIKESEIPGRIKKYREDKDFWYYEPIK
jgi:hypothetical protein